jgi:hypothetical protein
MNHLIIAAALLLASPVLAQSVPPAKDAKADPFVQKTYDMTTPILGTDDVAMRDAFDNKDPKGDPNCDKCGPLTVGVVISQAEFGMPSDEEKKMAPTALASLIYWRGALATRVRNDRAATLTSDELNDIKNNVARVFQPSPIVVYRILSFLVPGDRPTAMPK